MALTLNFVPSKFPRTLTRKEWKEIWRWKRMTEKRLDTALESQREALAIHIANCPLFGCPHYYLLDSLVNPPLLVHDKQML
jgi:hypothetical protein